jgi:hypothetical protein
MVHGPGFNSDGICSKTQNGGHIDIRQDRLPSAEMALLMHAVYDSNR